MVLIVTVLNEERYATRPNGWQRNQLATIECLYLGVRYNIRLIKDKDDPRQYSSSAVIYVSEDSRDYIFRSHTGGFKKRQDAIDAMHDWAQIQIASMKWVP